MHAATVRGFRQGEGGHNALSPDVFLISISLSFFLSLSLSFFFSKSVEMGQKTNQNDISPPPFPSGLKELCISEFHLRSRFFSVRGSPTEY
jgi:hypothetical protein